MLHGCVRPIEGFIRKQKEHSMQQIAIETRPKTSAATEAFSAMRAKSLQIAAPLSPEDCQVQSMPDASPIKWHLAHTTWFYETFILEPHALHYACFDRSFKVLFNSYYNTVGDKHPRPDRGLLSRPSLDRVLEYRAFVDAAMREFLADDVRAASVHQLITLGLNHEQQHQELMLTDLKHLLSVNPLLPRYVERDSPVAASTITGHGRSSFTGGSSKSATATSRFRSTTKRRAIKSFCARTNSPTIS